VEATLLSDLLNLEWVLELASVNLMALRSASSVNESWKWVPFDDALCYTLFGALHAAIMDDCYEHRQSPYCLTIRSEKIAFHQPDDDDPDWIVK